MTEVVDPFWTEKPSVLYRYDRLIEFFITCDQNIAEKLNSIVRLGVYISVILGLYFNNPKYLLLAVMSFILTFFVYKYTDKKQETFSCKLDQNNSASKKITIKPTLNNPFMNPNLMDEPNTPPAYDYTEASPESENIKKNMKEAFDYNLYQDVGDLYSTGNSFRQFYTIPEDDTDGNFKEFLYGDMHSAKENTYNSYKNLYEPLQSKRNTKLN